MHSYSTSIVASRTLFEFYCDGDGMRSGWLRCLPSARSFARGCRNSVKRNSYVEAALSCRVPAPCLLHCAVLCASARLSQNAEEHYGAGRVHACHPQRVLHTLLTLRVE